MAASSSPSSPPLLVGLSFGSSSVLVSVSRFSSPSVEVLANAAGDRSTPAVVAFTDREALVGNAALGQWSQNQPNTVTDLPALFCARSPSDVSSSPNTLISDGGRLMVEVKVNNATKRLSPAEIATHLFQSVHKLCVGYIGADPSQSSVRIPAVLSVPHQWEAEADKFSAAKEQYKSAAESAGFEVLSFLSDPAAVLLSHSRDVVSTSVSRSLVIDFGSSGIRFTVATVNAAGLISYCGHKELPIGGRQFDDLLFAHFSKEFSKQSGGLDIAQSSRAVFRLRTECEAAKRVLSSSSSAFIECDSLYQGQDFSSKITRAKFESLARDLFDQIKSELDSFLQSLAITSAEVTEVLLAGGSARIPRFQTAIRQFFSFDPVLLPNPEESAAIGCGKEAIRRSKIQTAGEKKPAALSSPALTLSLGVSDSAGRFVRVLPRGVALPAKAVFLVTPAADSKTSAVELFEGESEKVHENKKLARLILIGKLANTISVEVKENGEISVQAGNAKYQIKADDKSRSSEAEAKSTISKQFQANMDRKRAAEKGEEEPVESKAEPVKAEPVQAAPEPEPEPAAAHPEIDDLD